MFEAFSGAQVADLCDELATLVKAAPAVAIVTCRKLARTIRAGLVDRPGAKAALLAVLGK